MSQKNRPRDSSDHIQIFDTDEFVGYDDLLADKRVVLHNGLSGNVLLSLALVHTKLYSILLLPLFH